MPKNMIIRLGVDASDFRKKMVQAGADAESAGKRIRKSLSMSELSSEVSSIMGWRNSSSGIMGAINGGNFDAAKNQLSILKSYRDQLAEAGFDDYQFGLVSERIKVLEYDLNAYEETLQRTADAEREAAGAADDLGDRSQKASIPVSKASRELREMSSTGRRLSIIPGFLRRIGSDADSSNNRLEKMVRTIRNVSVVSFGLRLVRGLFGELGTIIRQHVAQDAALQAQVDTLKASFGQSLAPAINITTNALSAMMPYIVGVSNAIGTLISALAGPSWTTVSSGANAAAKAIGGAGGAQEKFNRSLQGFDEITKLDSKSSGGGGGGGSTTAATPTEGKLPEWMAGIVDQLSEAISQGDWAKVGNVLAKGFSDTVNNIGWAGAFRNVGSFLGGVGAVIWGAVGDSLEKHWAHLNQKTIEFGGNIWMGIGAGISQALQKIGSWVKENFLTPMVDGFKSTFRIHSPSTHPEIVGIGKNIMLGLLNGILEPLKNPIDWIKEHIFTPLVDGINSVFGQDSAVGKSVSTWLLGGKDTSAKTEVDVEANVTGINDKVRNKDLDRFSVVIRDYYDKLGEKELQNGTMVVTSVEDKAKSKVFGGGTLQMAAVEDKAKSKVFGGGTLQMGTVVDKTKSKTFGGGTLWINSMVDKAQSKTFGGGTLQVAAVEDKAKSKVFGGGTLQMGTVVDKTKSKTFEGGSLWINSMVDKAQSKTFGGGTLQVAAVEDKAKSKVFGGGTLQVDSWKDNIAADSKKLSLKANVSKGWQGSLESSLGIANLYAKLHLDTPDVKVSWSTQQSPNQNAEVDVPKYTVSYNARGALFTNASLLGRVGRDWQVAGEAGREALLPLDRHTWWMDDIADRVVSRIPGGGAGGEQTITVNLVADGKALASTVVRHVNAQARATGRNPLAAYI